jgi:serine/threonine-protein phosphatase 2B regulatory subunit
LLIALANFSGAAKDDKMKFAFMMYDEESTGSITHRELVKILRANHMAQSEAEVARKAETIIASLSKNDGTLSFDEMIVISKKFPNILFSSAGGLSSPTSP